MQLTYTNDNAFPVDHIFPNGMRVTGIGPGETATVETDPAKAAKQPKVFSNTPKVEAPKQEAPKTASTPSTARK